MSRPVRALLVGMAVALALASAPAVTAETQEYDDWVVYGQVTKPNPAAYFAVGLSETVETQLNCGQEPAPSVDGKWLDVPTLAQGKDFLLHAREYWRTPADDFDIVWYDAECRYLRGSFNKGVNGWRETGRVPAGTEYAVVNLHDGPNCQPGVLADRCADFLLFVYEVFPRNP